MKKIKILAIVVFILQLSSQAAVVEILGGVASTTVGAWAISTYLNESMEKRENIKNEAAFVLSEFNINGNFIMSQELIHAIEDLREKYIIPVDASNEEILEAIILAE